MQIDIEQITTQAVAWTPRLITALAILVGFWAIYKVTRRPIRYAMKRADFDEVLIRMLVDSVYRYTVFIFGIIMAASQLGINVGAALAGVGVIGIAVGFAAQDSLSNIIAGFLIFWDKPFRIKDWITVSDQYGQVTDITMRSTRIRTRSNTYVIIPNKNIIDEVLTNHSKNGPTRIKVSVGIAYKESIEQAREVILKAISEMDIVLEHPKPNVVVEMLDSSSVNLSVRAWIKNTDHERPVSFQMRETSKTALDDAGIEIPFPHLQLFVDDVKQPVWEKYQSSLANKQVEN